LEGLLPEMESHELSIRDTIDAHIGFAEAYKRMMTLIGNQGLFFCFERLPSNGHHAVDKREMGAYVIWTIFVYLLSIVYDDIKPNKAYVFRPYVKHLLGAHIEGQHQKLYSLYLGELVVQRKNHLRDELSELREIASHIRDYSETLPSIKGQTAVLLAILSTTSTLLSIAGISIIGQEGIITSQINSILGPSLYYIVPTILLIAIAAYVIGVGFAFIVAFHFKRFLFRNYNSQGPIYFSYKEANPSLYDSSIYKLEDQLFGLLGAKGQKRK
jgi:hypothetical protein